MPAELITLDGALEHKSCEGWRRLRLKGILEVQQRIGLNISASNLEHSPIQLGLRSEKEKIGDFLKY